MISDQIFLNLKKRTCLFFLYLISILLFLTSDVFCQDSLYLIGTITGKSTTEKIIDVKGVGDINGDGYDDFMVSVGYHSIQLYLGSPNLNLTPSIIFHYPGKETPNGLGNMAGIGDVNGDGFNDFLLGGSYDNGSGGKGKVFLYYGGKHIDTIPVMEFSEPWIMDQFGSALQGVGDLNKDGYDDFVIGSQYNWTDGKGRVYLFYGGDTISFARSITFSDTLGGFFGKSVANIGDINGDGFDDIAISAEVPSVDSGRVYIYHGGMTMDTIPDTVLTSNYLDYSFGRIIKNAGDLNKDGLTNFCIAGGNKIFIYNGLSEPLVIKGYSLGAGGDINHDGYNDIIIGNDGEIKGFYGSFNFDTTSDFTIKTNDTLTGFSSNIAIAGDINGDGFDEIIALAPNWPNTNNPLGRVYIYSHRKLTDVKQNKDITLNKFGLYQNYPNPFNPNTVISYQLSERSHVYLRVYDMLGREIKALLDREQEAGVHNVNFNGSGLSSGVYLYRLSAGNLIAQKSMLLLK
jgi:hypothetical protein